MHLLSTPESFFDAASPRPFVTYYDEDASERTELSARSLANWVAKTHFLLTDELGLGVGATAQISLPAHWLSVAPVLGSLTAGLALTASDEPTEVAFVAPGRPSAADDVYTVTPDGDYVDAVRPQADAWAGVRMPATDNDPCLPAYSRAEVVDLARARAIDLGVDEGARVLTTRDWDGPLDWVDLLFVPLVMKGSVVYVCGDASEETITRRMQQERATVRI